LLRTTGLLAAFLPELIEGVGQLQDSRYAGDVYRHTLATVESTPARLSLRLAALLHDVAKPGTAQKRVAGDGFDFPQHADRGASIAEQVLERLKFPRAMIDEVCLMVRHHGLEDIDSWSDSALRRFAAALGPSISSQLDLVRANLLGREVDVQKNIERATEFRERTMHLLQGNPPLTSKSLALDGHAIMRILDIGPSPEVGEATRFLMDQVLENPGLNSVDRLGELLRNWAKSHSG
jgi:putative nucleotidyltransferase with HDIG domain